MRLLLVAEPSMTRDAIADFLRRHSKLDCLALVDDGQELVRLTEKASFDVVLIDIRQREHNGLALARRYRELDAGAAVVLLIDHDLPEYHEAARAAGADAFVLRQSLAAELIRLLTLIQQQRPQVCRSV